MEENTITLKKPTVSVPTEIKSESKYPTEIIELPSKGYFYDSSNPLSSGHVEVKMITAKEEDILTNTNLIRKGQVLDKLLESVLIDKKIKTSDFLISDINAVYVALRRLAYGDSYGPLNITCPACNEENKDIDIDLSKLEYKDGDLTGCEKGLNSFKFLLPKCKKTITFKLLTTKDTEQIDAEIKVNAKLKLSNNDLTTRMKQLITSVDGNTDVGFIRNFVEKELPSKDSLEIRKHIKKITPTIDMGYTITCEHCDSQERITVPLTAQFFWPDSSR